jgi:transposase-like protein
MNEKEYFEKVLDRSAEELVKELFPNGITTQEKIGIRKLLESVVELIMNQERNFFLENDEDNKANGYYERSLNTGSFKLNINVQRDRKDRLRPQILPDSYKRVNEVVKDVSAETLLRETIKKVKRGSLIHTDKFKSYDGLVMDGFKYERIDKCVKFARGC